MLRLILVILLNLSHRIAQFLCLYVNELNNRTWREIRPRGRPSKQHYTDISQQHSSWICSVYREVSCNYQSDLINVSHFVSF